jgi:predicted nucleotidyltransferase
LKTKNSPRSVADTRVKELSLFGSACWKASLRVDSDIDLLVEFTPGVRVGLLQFQSLVEELELLTGRRVDLVKMRW